MSEDVLSDAFFDARERDLKKRLKPKRFEHARGCLLYTSPSPRDCS